MWLASPPPPRKNENMGGQPHLPHMAILNFDSFFLFFGKYAEIVIEHFHFEFAKNEPIKAMMQTDSPSIWAFKCWYLVFWYCIKLFAMRHAMNIFESTSILNLNSTNDYFVKMRMTRVSIQFKNEMSKLYI